MTNDGFDNVGPRLRLLRRARNLTLAQVSGVTGVSVSTLSRLESGSRRPTLALLLALSRTYAVTLDELVDAPAVGDPRVDLKPAQIASGTIFPLTNRPGEMRVYKMVLRPVRRTRTLEAHEGIDWLYVVEGSLRLVLGDGPDAADLVVGAGQVVEFDGRVPHWFGCAARRVVEVLGIFGAQGERLHVRSG